MDIKDMPHVTVEQVLDLRKAAIKSVADNKALREELEALRQSIPKIRADAILKVLDTPHDCETPNGDIAWSSGSLELLAEFQLNANKIEAE